MIPSSSFGPGKRQRGVSVITAVFLLLLFAGLAALMANVISTTHTTSAQDVLGAKAYQAARAGIEWGLYKVMENPDTTTAVAATATCPTAVTLPNCPTSAFPVASLEGFSVNYQCEAYDGTSGPYQEGCRRIRIFRLTATATGPGPGGTTIERRLQVTAEKCRDASSTVAPYDC